MANGRLGPGLEMWKELEGGKRKGKGERRETGWDGAHSRDMTKADVGLWSRRLWEEGDPEARWSEGKP